MAMINISDATERLRSLHQTLQPVLKVYHKERSEEAVKFLFNQLASNQTSIMVCGEFKRGKSTFINALLKMDVCPTDEHIATSTVSIIKYGEQPRVTRVYDTENGVKEEVIDYNKINQFAKGTNLSIDHTLMLIIEVPCERLKAGLTLIDTPGVEGLNPRHRLLTLSAISRANVIFYMLSAGEPMTTLELDFLKNDILPHSRDYKVIMNRVDELDVDEVDAAVADCQRKISTYCRVPDVEVIPVSAYLWQEDNRQPNPDDRKASNADNVEKAIDQVCYTYHLSLLQKLRQILADDVQAISALISEELAQLTDSNPERMAQILERREQFQHMLSGLQQDGSAIRKQVSNILKEARSEVMSEIARKNILLSSDRLDEILHDDRAVGSDGEKWVLNQINEDVQKLIRNIDSTINKSFEKSAEIIQAELQVMQQTFTKRIDANLEARERKDGEVTCGMVRQVLPGLSVGGLGWGVASVAGGFFSGFGTALTGTALGSLSVGLGALISTIALPVGIVAGAAFIWQSLKGETNARRIAEMHKRLVPRITLLTNEIQSYVNKRYDEFSTAVDDYFEGTAKELSAQITDLQEIYKKCQQNSLAIASRKRALEEKLKMLKTAGVQLEALLSSPFVKNRQSGSETSKRK